MEGSKRGDLVLGSSKKAHKCDAIAFRPWEIHLPYLPPAVSLVYQLYACLRIGISHRQSRKDSERGHVIMMSG